MKSMTTSFAFLALLGLSGCGFAASPISSAISVKVKANVAGAYLDNSVQPIKRGESYAKSILFVGVGDASIKTAMQNGGITKVHHVETESLNALGFYARYRTIVYGE